MCPDSVPGGGCNSIGIRTCVTHTCDTALNSTFSSCGSLVHIASDCHRRMRLCSTRHRFLSDAASARRSYASSDVVAPFHRALVPHARIHSTRAYAPTVPCRSTVHSSVSFSRLRLRESVNRSARETVGVSVHLLVVIFLLASTLPPVFSDAQSPYIRVPFCQHAHYRFRFLYTLRHAPIIHPVCHAYMNAYGASVI